MTPTFGAISAGCGTVVKFSESLPLISVAILFGRFAQFSAQAAKPQVNALALPIPTG